VSPGDLVRVATLEGLHGLEYYNATRALGRVGVVVDDQGGALVNFKPLREDAERWRLCLIEGRLYMLPTRCMVKLQRSEGEG